MSKKSILDIDDQGLNCVYESYLFYTESSLGVAWANSAGAMGNKTLFAGKLTFVDVTFVLFVDTNLRLAKSIANARQNVTKITSTYNRHIILSKISISAS